MTNKPKPALRQAAYFTPMARPVKPAVRQVDRPINKTNQPFDGYSETITAGEQEITDRDRTSVDLTISDLTPRCPSCGCTTSRNGYALRCDSPRCKWGGEVEPDELDAATAQVVSARDKLEALREAVAAAELEHKVAVERRIQLANTRRRHQLKEDK